MYTHLPAPLNRQTAQPRQLAHRRKRIAVQQAAALAADREGRQAVQVLQRG